MRAGLPGQFFTPNGATVGLARQLAVGGQGAIHEVTGRPDLVAKLYLQPPNAALAAKLRALVEMPSARKPAAVIWPTDLLLHHGQVVGFLMLRIIGRHDLHMLAAPTSRRRQYPTADYRSLVVTAANLARCVAAVHDAGHVIGDINDRFAMVDDRATVALIDADSFQVEHDGVRHLCDVAVPMYQPPELQNLSSFRGVVRARNHDAFGLAVLIFQLLFLNRHPFQGVPVGGDVPEIPQAIARHQFAFSRAARARGLTAPPNALALDDVSPELAGLFERAFGPDGAGQGADGKGRPTASRWVPALDAFARSLRRCPVNDGHWHHGRACPLCTIEGRIGTLLFMPRTAGAGQGDPAELAQRLWARIAAVPPPTPWGAQPAVAPLSAIVRGSPYPQAAAPVGLWQRLRAAVGLWTDPAFAAEQTRRRQALEKARATHHDACVRWRLADDGRTTFATALNRLQQARNELQALPQLRAQKLAALQASARQRQLHDFLEGFDLSRARIKGIGASLAAMLEGVGFETAADCEEAALRRMQLARQLPGIGPAKLAAVLAWRRECEARFRFDPARLVTPQDLAALNLEMARIQTGLVQQLEQGPAALREIAQAAEARREQAHNALGASAMMLAQAEADMAVQPK